MAPSMMNQPTQAQASGGDQLSNILSAGQPTQQQGGNQDALIKLMLLDPKNAELYQKMWDAKFGGTQSAKPANATEKVKYDLGNAGIKSLTEAEQLFAQDPSLVWKQEVPGKWFSRQFDAAMTRAVENLLRANSGAAVPESEVRRYLSMYGPKLGDDPATIQSKFKAIRDNLTAIATPIAGLGGQMNTDSQMLNSLLMGGVAQ
jgi:hypothetical protein